MTGLQFLTDVRGEKMAAVIDLRTHKALWEDIADVLVPRSRRHERGVPLEEGEGWADCQRQAAWVSTRLS